MNHTPRRKRSEKPLKRAYRLHARDYEILRAVGRMGTALTEHIRRLFFGDASTASRRLAKLVALGLLAVHVLSTNEPNLYTLTDKGMQVLENQDIERAELHQSRVSRALDLHLKLLNDLRVEVVCAARERSDVELVSFLADLDLRRLSGTSQQPYIPDAIFELKTDAGSLVVVAEIDTGTETLSTFRTKVNHTMELARTRRACWGAEPGSWWPLVLVPSAGRARTLARAITEADGGEFWLVTEFDRLREVGAFGPLLAFASAVAATPSKEPIAYQGALATAPHEVPS